MDLMHVGLAVLLGGWLVWFLLQISNRPSDWLAGVTYVGRAVTGLCSMALLWVALCYVLRWLFR
jgi:hypothetical protein